MQDKRLGILGWAMREVALVVVGVLIAFALNAWWVARGVHDQEQVHLRALVSDFEQNAGRLREVSRREQRASESSLKLLEIAQINPIPSEETITPLLNLALSSSRFEAVTGAYDALLNSGGLTLIHDTALRASLATFSSEADARYSERFAEELYVSFIREFAGQLQFANLVLKHTPDGVAYRKLLRDPKFRDYLAFRYATEGEVAARYAALERECTEILERLRGQLTTRPSP